MAAEISNLQSGAQGAGLDWYESNRQCFRSGNMWLNIQYSQPQPLGTFLNGKSADSQVVSDFLHPIITISFK